MFRHLTYDSRAVLSTVPCVDDGIRPEWLVPPPNPPPQTKTHTVRDHRGATVARGSKEKGKIQSRLMMTPNQGLKPHTLCRSPRNRPPHGGSLTSSSQVAGRSSRRPERVFYYSRVNQNNARFGFFGVFLFRLCVWHNFGRAKRGFFSQPFL